MVMKRPDYLPNHPSWEGPVIAFFLAAMVGYAMLAIYVVGQLILK